MGAIRSAAWTDAPAAIAIVAAMMADACRAGFVTSIESSSVSGLLPGKATGLLSSFGAESPAEAQDWPATLHQSSSASSLVGRFGASVHRLV